MVVLGASSTGASASCGAFPVEVPAAGFSLAAARGAGVAG